MTFRAPQPYDMVSLDDAAAVLAAVPEYWRPRIASPEEFIAGLRATGYRSDMMRATIADRASDVGGLSSEAVDAGVLAIVNLLLDADIYVGYGEDVADALNHWVAERREWAEEMGREADAEEIALAEALAARPPRTLAAVFAADIADEVSRATLRHIAALATGDADDFGREAASISRDGWKRAARVWREVEAARSARAAA